MTADDRPRKRGRPPKSKVLESPRATAMPPSPAVGQPAAAPVQTPQLKTASLPHASPTQVSPPKSTPTKGTVIKALPTVRDHTTDQLNQEGDEYIPREFDDAGEKKVAQNGAALGGREYRCRTFFVQGRGDRLFMLATECARVLGYRDSYLLFNKNRSLFKIIATQAEKDDLISQEILPYSYRSRQIAIVTARSMFRQFGSRLIVNGRRVRDDYWESKARKQGFTEEDAAGEKRPGAAKAREAAAAEASNAALAALPHGEISYISAPIDAVHGAGPINPSTMAPPLPMITDARDYSNVQRPRHEISGPPYQDRLQPSQPADVLTQAANTAEFNKVLNQQRSSRAKYMEEYWNRPHEVPSTPPQRQATAEGGEVGPTATQAMHSPQVPAAAAGLPSAQQNMVPRPPSQSHMMAPQQFQQQAHPQNPMAQSPMHSMHQPIRPDQMHHRPPSMNIGPGGSHAQAQPYGYPNQMWPPSQPQPSPLSQQHNVQQYGQPQASPSPHPQQSPLHSSPQLHHPQSTGSMHGAPMGYPTMGGMPQGGYGMPRNPYQPGANPQQFMHPSTAAQQPGMQGWAPGQPSHGQQPGWQGF